MNWLSDDCVPACVVPRSPARQRDVSTRGKVGSPGVEPAGRVHRERTPRWPGAAPAGPGAEGRLIELAHSFEQAVWVRADRRQRRRRYSDRSLLADRRRGHVRLVNLGSSPVWQWARFGIIWGILLSDRMSSATYRLAERRPLSPIRPDPRRYLEWCGHVFCPRRRERPSGPKARDGRLDFKQHMKQRRALV